MDDLFICYTSWVDHNGSHHCMNVNEDHDCRCCCGEGPPLVVRMDPPQKWKGWRNRPRKGKT